MSEQPDPAEPTLASVDLFAVDEITQPLDIWPCRDCASWHVEVHRRASDRRVVVREWHDAECEHVRSLLADENEDDQG